MSRLFTYLLLFLRSYKVLRLRDGASPSKTKIGLILFFLSHRILLNIHFKPSSTFSKMELTLTIHREASIAKTSPERS